MALSAIITIVATAMMPDYTKQVFRCVGGAVLLAKPVDCQIAQP
jgi:hypothetical protein